ncbi:MAG: response regulator [Leptolyngbya sp. SIO1E4]|nr:response regulator [Leptolyngbya sp. SIO1E4]
MSSHFEMLLVEDDAADIDLTQEALSTAGLHVNLNVVRNGTDALSYLHQQSPFQDTAAPDLILLDLNLPGMSGKEIIREIRGDKKLCHIPITVLTTSRSKQDIEDSYKLGANCYVSKPDSLDEFNQMIQALEKFWFTVAKIPTRNIL